MSGARRVRGRHARVIAGRPPAMTSSRRVRVTLAGAAGLGLTLAGSTIALLRLLPGGSAETPRTTPVNALRPATGARPVAAPAGAAPARPVRSRRGDKAALAFYEWKDPVRAAHVTEVVWTGPMLRVYTDLPASAADGKTAIALCRTAAAYAEARDRIPEVFVHADRESGYPVLANKMDAGDDCRLGRVP